MLFQPVIISYFPGRFHPSVAVRAEPILYPQVQNISVICLILFMINCV